MVNVLQLISRTNYISNDPISKQGNILKYWGLGLEHIFRGRQNFTHNSRKTAAPHITSRHNILSK